LDANRALPVASGTPVTWTAKTVGGTAGPLLFRFVKYSVTTGTWTLMQDYSTSRTFTWTPSFADAGSHLLPVWVNSTGSTAPYDAYNTTGYFDVQSAPMQLAADALFPLPPTQKVTWTASVPDTSTPVEYAFFLYDQSKGTWSQARAYSTTSTFAWTPGVAG